MHGCTSANITEKGGKVSRQSGHMFSGQLVIKGYLIEAIVFEGEINYPNGISFGTHTLIPKQLYCNIIKHILFFKVKILRDRDVEVLTNHCRGELIDMAPNKNSLKLWFPLDNNVVTKVGIELMHNLNNEPTNITNRKSPTLILNQYLNTQSHKTI